MLSNYHPTTTHVKSYKDLIQGSNKVMHWLSHSIIDSMIRHIQDVEFPKEAWDKLVKFFATNTKTKKNQLKTKLNTIERKNMTISEYDINILRANSLRIDKAGHVKFRFLIEINNKYILKDVINNIIKIDSVYDAFRILPGK